jgi:hypothetical protein
MPKVLPRSLEQIAKQFGRLSADHTRDMDTLRSAPTLLRRYRERATEAGKLIIEIRGVYGDGRNKDDDRPDPRHVAGVSPKVLGRNVRRGFKWEDDYARGSDDHARALWGRGVIGEWMPIRTPAQFSSSTAEHWQIVERVHRIQGDDQFADTMTLLKNSRDACDAMQTELHDGIQEQEPGFVANSTKVVSSVPLVVLRGIGQKPIVCGKEVEAITEPRYRVVEALIKAGPDGLSKADMEAVKANAIRYLSELSKRPGWKKAIIMAGQPWKKYRIVHR